MVLPTYLTTDNLQILMNRTLRVPDNSDYVAMLPPGLGQFALKPASIYAKVPAAWRERNNAYIMPMYTNEALWLGFSPTHVPSAVQVFVGTVNAVTGETEEIGLRADSQNYMVTPPQRWLDGMKTDDGIVRQFVAIPFNGKTVGEQIANVKDSSIHIRVYSHRNPEKFTRPVRRGRAICSIDGDECGINVSSYSGSTIQSIDLGIGAGGMIQQNIYPDPEGFDAWNTETYEEATIYIVNALQWEEVTGEKPTHQMPDPSMYQYYGFPWFRLQDEGYGDIETVEQLWRIKSAYSGNEPAIVPGPVHNIAM